MSTFGKLSTTTAAAAAVGAVSLDENRLLLYTTLRERHDEVPMKPNDLPPLSDHLAWGREPVVVNAGWMAGCAYRIQVNYYQRGLRPSSPSTSPL